MKNSTFYVLFMIMALITQVLNVFKMYDLSTTINSFILFWVVLRHANYFIKEEKDERK